MKKLFIFLLIGLTEAIIKKNEKIIQKNGNLTVKVQVPDVDENKYTNIQVYIKENDADGYAHVIKSKYSKGVVTTYYGKNGNKNGREIIEFKWNRTEIEIKFKIKIHEIKIIKKEKMKNIRKIKKTEIIYHVTHQTSKDKYDGTGLLFTGGVTGKKVGLSLFDPRDTPVL